MIKNDINPTPLIGKRPLLDAWQKIVADADAAARWGNQGTGTGMLTARTPVIDVDILDEAAAELVEQTIRECVGDAGDILVRVGQFPKRAIPLRTDEPFRKIVRRFNAPDGSAHKIEVLCDGQQLAVAGIHPDTNKPFAWRGGRSPVNTPRDALPLVTEAEVIAILDLCSEQLRKKLGWTEQAASEPPPGGAPGPDIPLADRIAATQYKGECGLNQAILDIPMAELDQGVTVECVIEQCMALAKKCWEGIPEEDGARAGWDWNAQRRQIEDSTYGHIKKNVAERPRLADTLPERLLKIWREIEGRGGIPELYKKRGLGRGEWSVKDAGPAEEIPTIDPPAKAGRKSEAKQLPRLEFLTASMLANIPPREFYLGKQYQRGAVSGTMSPGGRGKSSLAAVEAMSMATARALLGEKPLRRLKVWYHNGEESWDELRRRLDVICLRYNIKPADFEGWLCVTNPQKFPLRVADVGSGERFSPDSALLTHMYEEIRSNEFDVIILDPLITLHGVPENNPVMMRGVMDIFRDIAAGINCSVEVVGHTRKPSMGFDGALTAYDTRGSGAIVDALRSVRMLDLMTEDEAEEAEVKEFERERHVKITPAKRNYSATGGEPQWIRIENLIINNGDDVGVVEPWTWPSRDPAFVEAAVQRAEDVFIEAMPVLSARGQRLSDRRGVNYAPKIIAETTAAKEMRVNETYLAAAMKRLIERGEIEVFDGYERGVNVHVLRVVPR
jgi:hypothetical protein